MTPRLVVFWLDEAGQARHLGLEDHELTQALALTERLRAAGAAHVCVSTAPTDLVGRPGVDAVEGGQLPDGTAYGWRKRR